MCIDDTKREVFGHAKEDGAAQDGLSMHQITFSLRSPFLSNLSYLVIVDKSIAEPHPWNQVQVDLPQDSMLREAIKFFGVI